MTDLVHESKINDRTYSANRTKRPSSTSEPLRLQLRLIGKFLSGIFASGNIGILVFVSIYVFAIDKREIYTVFATALYKSAVDVAYKQNKFKAATFK